MNFNLIEEAYVDVEEIYPDFKADYLGTNIHSNDLRLKYGLSHKDFWDLAREVKQEVGLRKRPIGYVPKYYYKVRSGYIIQKRYDRNMIYLGFVPSERIAKQMVKLCKNHLWDIDVCKNIIHNWRDYAV